VRLGDYLKDKYGLNEPIFIDEIQFNNYSRAWIFVELRKMVESGEIKRFESGVYYFPTKMFFGDSLLDSRKVVKRRFLSDGAEVYGYIAGASLMNLAGLSTQVPNLIELVTNKESTRVRNINIGAQRVRARRGRTIITKDNVAALRLLDLMNVVTPAIMDEIEIFMLAKYTKDSGVTRKEISRYASLFPAKAMKNMIESGAVYELA